MAHMTRHMSLSQLADSAQRGEGGVSLSTLCAEEPGGEVHVPRTKVVGTLGPTTASIETLETMLRAGLSVARFDFSGWGPATQQAMLDNLRAASSRTGRLCAVMMDTIGPELFVRGSATDVVDIEEGSTVTVRYDASGDLVATSSLLPINYEHVHEVSAGDTIFVGQYLFTGADTTSLFMTVTEVVGKDVRCIAKNGCSLKGEVLTALLQNMHVKRQTLTEDDKRDISTWGVQNQVDFISLSFTRSGADVQDCRTFLDSVGLNDTKILAKIEDAEAIRNFPAILAKADGIIFSRGNVGIDVSSEKVFLAQKYVLQEANLAGKPAIITRVVDTMTHTPRPTRAEATDVANAVLDGADGFLLGAETARGIFPTDTIDTVLKISAEAEKYFDHSAHYLKVMKAAPDPMCITEALSSSAVRTAQKIGAKLLVVFTQTGKTVDMMCKYRPSMPIMSVVVPKLKSNQISWTFTGEVQARQALLMHGVFPMLADPSQHYEAEFSGSVGAPPQRSESFEHNLEAMSTRRQQNAITRSDSAEKHGRGPSTPTTPGGHSEVGARHSDDGILGMTLTLAERLDWVHAGDLIVVSQRTGGEQIVKIITA